MTSPSSILPPDPLLEVLSRLPPKSLVRLQYASHPVQTLIRAHLLRAHRQPLLGFFLRSPQSHYSRLPFFPAQNPSPNVDTRLSFLPPCHHFILDDCCNGLLLFHSAHPRTAYYVCNPATRALARIPGLHPALPGFLALAFDPWASPNYNIISIRSQELRIYSSETGRWGERRVVEMVAASSKRAWGFCDGAVYAAVAGGIVRYGAAEGDCEVIGYPEGAEKKVGVGAWIGRLGGSLCYADLVGARLTVWSLGRDGVWAVKHRRDVGAFGSLSSPCIWGFHPDSEAAFLLVGSKVFQYDLNSTALEDLFCVCRGYRFDMIEEAAFPFFPCLLDGLG